MRKETMQLLHEIKSSEGIYCFFHDNQDEIFRESAHDFLLRKLQEKNLKVSDVINQSENGDYIYKVFAGTRRASRDILISIAFGLELDIEDTQMLLRLAGTARLDPRNRRDAVTLYVLLKGRNITDLNELLYDMQEELY